MLATLLNRGADANAIHPENGFTAMHVAAYTGNYLGVETLLKHGGNPSIVNAQGWTALHAAAEKFYSGFGEAMRIFVMTNMLMAHDVDALALDNDGYAAYDYVVKKHRYHSADEKSPLAATAAILLQAMGGKDGEGRTATYWAELSGSKIDRASKMVYELVVENLCTLNAQSGEYVPLIAERWDISPDGKVFTFYLNKKAKFSDGTPVTTKDVQAFWDILHNPKNIIGGVRSELSKFNKLEVVDTHTLKLHAQTARFSNLSTLCDYFGVTSHKYYLAKGTNYNKSFSNKIFGSGPYLVDKVKKGKMITLVRNKNYWGAHLPQNVGRYNFDKLVLRTVEDATIRFELFKKGKIDMFAFSDAKRWKMDTASEKFQKTWVVARRVD